MNDSLSGKLVLQSFYNNQFQYCEDIEFICKIMSSVHDEKYKYINIYFRFIFFLFFFFLCHLNLHYMKFINTS